MTSFLIIAHRMDEAYDGLLEQLDTLPMYAEVMQLLGSVPKEALQIQQDFESVKESFFAFVSSGADTILLDKHAKSVMERVRQLQVQLDALQAELRSRLEFLRLLELIKAEQDAPFQLSLIRNDKSNAPLDGLSVLVNRHREDHRHHQ